MVQIASISPVLLVADIFETAKYYRDVLGFDFDEIHGEPPSFVVAQRDGARLMFRQPRDGAPPPANGAVSPAFPIDVFLYVRDVEALAAELRGKGADILEGPVHRQIWNGKELTVRDCDGRVLCFGQAMDRRSPRPPFERTNRRTSSSQRRSNIADHPSLDRPDLRALETDAAATFVLTPTGRILHENEPGLPAGPRLFVGGCRDGQVALVRHDVEASVAARIGELVEASPPWFDPAVPHPALDELIALLAPVESVSSAIIYRLPRGLAFDVDAAFVASGTAEGERLLGRLAEEGMPPLLVDAGFVGLEDFWAPWCVAVADGEIAAMAFAARLGEAGAEIGVYTFLPYRDRGLAAAVTARWSGLPELEDRMLFYSTLSTNLSSQRVAARLDLPRLGASLRIV